MSVPPPHFMVEVSHGHDRGSRLTIGDTPCTIGRAADRDLTLTDLAVSRHHLVAVAVADGLRLSVSELATAVIVEGRPFRSIDLKPGDSFLIGNTTLTVQDGAAWPPADRPSSHSRMDLRTFLGGPGAEALAMSALHKLIESADAAPDANELLAALRSWAGELAPPSSVAMVTGGDASADLIEEEMGGQTLLVVPAPANEPVSLHVTYALSADRLPAVCRRMWVVAGRLFGSSLVRVWRDEVAAAEVASLRIRSFGSARSFLGTSPAAEHMARLLPRLAENSSSVLLEGETGVGKTFVARLIHENGPRAKEPLRVVSCGALPPSLIESELFGHERGAFTGAIAQRIGAFESAGRGTIFLDEIGELPLSCQATLLRVLEDRKFERVGSNQPRSLEARIVTATNRNLAAMVEAKLFRSDLFFRISVVRLTVPPLRDRGEDRVLLAEYLLRDAASTATRRISGFSTDALDAIRAYSWPGNVRELRNVIEYAAAVGEGATIRACDFPAEVCGAPPRPQDEDVVYLPLSLEELERRGVAAAMRSTQGNQRRAAALLGISRSTLNVHLAASRKSDSKS